ncbi:MAG: hypothetical protein WC455_29710 [Dehalococcoidia bacterium]|jgi:hypothetical protein
MKLQRWTVYRRYDQDNTEDIGSVVTSYHAKSEIAWAKAAHKFIPKPYFTLGYSLHVRKSEAAIAKATGKE